MGAAGVTGLGSSIYRFTLASESESCERESKRESRARNERVARSFFPPIGVSRALFFVSVRE